MIEYTSIPCPYCGGARKVAVGFTLRRVRRAAGRSQGWVASQLGLKQATISDIERGRRYASDEALALYRQLEREPQMRQRHRKETS